MKVAATSFEARTRPGHTLVVQPIYGHPTGSLITCPNDPKSALDFFSWDPLLRCQLTDVVLASAFSIGVGMISTRATLVVVGD